MRKSLFAIGLLAATYSVQAQNVLVHVDDAATTYVSEGTLVYSGGGIQTRGAGIVDVHGNVMVDATPTDAFKTITTGGANKTDGGNIVLRLNTPGSYDSSTYGQLYINGISAGNLTGVVSKEYRTAKNGNGNYFQQMALPFAGKAYSTLSTELNKTFGTTRTLNNPGFVNNDLILSWNNASAVSDHVTNLANTTPNSPAYYMLGSRSNNLDLSTPPSTLPTIAPTPTGTVYTLNGAPVRSEDLTAVSLQNAGNVSFGTNGLGYNTYGEQYATYLQDQFSNTTGKFVGNFGKNIYQFGNPYFTNLDLSRIGYVESGGVTDGNAVSNIWGVKYTTGTVVSYAGGSNGGGGTYTTGAQVQTYTTLGVPVGDTGLIIKPMQTFVLKLRDNTAQTLNFSTLRRFNSTVRAANVDYNVNAAKSSANTTFGQKGTTNTVKQLGVIALDANGKEVGRTYYVVNPNFTTGHQTSSATTVQASATGGDVIGTFEEAPNGGYDNNNLNYWLYINEANEVNFLGKNIKLVNYNTNVVKSYKFEVKENGELVNNGVHQLSSGIGFYYKAANGNLQQAVQGGTTSAITTEADLYYGELTGVVLATNDTKSPSRTLVVYNPAIDNYIVRFDPNWKKADIEVYDMSGKLVISKKAVETSRDFVIELDKNIKNSYVVKVVSDKGDIVNTKILK
ncbi:T9SS type A sorting domain-containing protein [Chryseobacterium gambrini]|uniref:T9SS type A sorting domain-containing protein n=1 Tax=Chryseobacterium gambrini TaxID=373672 RepID=UPI0022F1B600|nr:T9SS type A sorting domain-containing protein [Chryseobacterium gambrini]WBV51832.1 T9SS type A sorting domain-containing protein [Chryseobacterium gambrini]